MRDGVTFLVYERLNYFPRFSRRAQNHGACQLAELDNPTMEGCSPLPRVEMPLVPSFEPSLAMPPNIFTDTSCYDIETGLDLVDTPCTGTWFRFRLTVSKYLPSARSDSTEVLLLALNGTLPEVAIKPQMKRKTNANDRLILESEISDWFGQKVCDLELDPPPEPPECVGLRWMVVQGDVSLNQLVSLELFSPDWNS